MQYPVRPGVVPARTHWTSTLQSLQTGPVRGVVAVAGAIFIAIDSLVTYTPISLWIRRHFRELAAPGVPKEDVEKAVPQISMRIVGMIHILIQVHSCCNAVMDKQPWMAPRSELYIIVLKMLLQEYAVKHVLKCHCPAYLIAVIFPVSAYNMVLVQCRG
jgi:hypothetical protein